jgi:hypothetical protein
MKITANGIGGLFTRSSDGRLSVDFADAHGRSITLELSEIAQRELIMGLLSSTQADPAGRFGYRIRPLGVSRFRYDNDVGLSFVVQKDLAVHMVLSRPLAEGLRTRLETFDDESTWDLRGETEQ